MPSSFYCMDAEDPNGFRVSRRSRAHTVPTKAVVTDCGKEKSNAMDEVLRFSKVHIRITVGVQLCSFVAFGSILTLEWISDLMAAEAKWVIDLSLLGEDVIFYDEELTSSARIYTLTTDIAWRDQYMLAVVPLDKALAEIKNQAPKLRSEFDAMTVAANDVLLEAEAAALDLALSNATAATERLFDGAYTTNKALLLEGVDALQASIEERRKAYDDRQSWWAIVSVSVVIAAFVAEVCSTVGITKLDDTLEEKAGKADDAKDEHSHIVRDALLHAMQEAIHGTSSKQDSDETPVNTCGASEKQSTRVAAKVNRIRRLATAVDIMGVLAVGIPSVLTLISLVNAGASDDLQQIVLHSRNIRYYDLVLTSSARLCTLTSDLSWESRYNEFVAPIENEIQALEQVDPGLVASFVKQTTAANDALIHLETVALKLCVADPPFAQSVMFGQEYKANKTMLNDGLIAMQKSVDAKKQTHDKSADEFAVISRILMIVCTLAVVGTDLLRVVLAVWADVCLRQHEQGSGDDEAEFMLTVEHLLKNLRANDGPQDGTQDHQAGQSVFKTAAKRDPLLAPLHVPGEIFQ